MEFDHLLFIGFGGPTRPDEVMPFLEQVTRGRPVPAERLKEVAHHYEAIGGSSPYNAYSFRLFEKVKESLFDISISMPMFLGMRNWEPFLKDTVAVIKSRGFQKGIAVILAPHRSEPSFERYKKSLEEALRSNEAEIEYEFIEPWFNHPLFIEAQADRVRSVLDSTGSKPDGIHLLFTAHSIPVEAAQTSTYEEEFKTSASLVAAEVGIDRWSTAYQSRSGSPHQPWLEPDVKDAARRLSEQGVKTLVAVPVGFISDNAEVLYDLDIELKAEVEKIGLIYRRASTVLDHPKFAAMFAKLIQDHRDACSC